ncbi:hypothetical protein A13G_02958 [Escherichia coli KTE185]|nr:hypothetical protein A13G_02958 [Escherichia coli KTE185]
MPAFAIDSWSFRLLCKFIGEKFTSTEYPVLVNVVPSLALPADQPVFIGIGEDGPVIADRPNLAPGESSAIFEHVRNMALRAGAGLAAGRSRDSLNPGGRSKDDVYGLGRTE